MESRRFDYHSIRESAASDFCSRAPADGGKFRAGLDGWPATDS